MAAASKAPRPPGIGTFLTYQDTNSASGNQTLCCRRRPTLELI
jgi:hypothetical protein